MKTGIIYHVVDKTTNEVVKVGSTIQTLQRRWVDYDKNKFNNHFLREVKRIESTESDWYEKGNAHCPFLWHLVASEHMEILRRQTWRKGRLSNQVSPLDQKYFGFLDAHLSTSALGAKNQSLEDKARGGRTQGPIQGPKNVQSGLWLRVVSLGGIASGRSKSEAKQKANEKNGDRFGRWSVDSGHLASFRTPEHQSKAGKAGGQKSIAAHPGLSLHFRWHVNRGIINPNCLLCRKGQNPECQPATQ